MNFLSNYYGAYLQYVWISTWNLIDFAVIDTAALLSQKRSKFKRETDTDHFIDFVGRENLFLYMNGLSMLFCKNSLFLLKYTSWSGFSLFLLFINVIIGINSL